MTGKLYGGLTIEDLHRGKVSQRRNPLIAELFRRIEMVEAWGARHDADSPKRPHCGLSAGGGAFIASFARPSFSLDAQETLQKALEDHKKPHKNHQEKMLALLAAQPAITMKDLAQLSGATLYSVRHHLESLKVAGRIRHVVPNKGGHWEVIAPEVKP